MFSCFRCPCRFVHWPGDNENQEELKNWSATMDEEDNSQEESFQDQQPRQSREATRRRSPAPLAGLLEGGEVAITVCTPPPANPNLLPHHLSDFVSSPGASPWGMDREREAPLEPTPGRQNPAGHIRSSRTLRVDQVEGSSQGRLAFYQPSDSIRQASISGSPDLSDQQSVLADFYDVVGPPVHQEVPPASLGARRANVREPHEGGLPVYQEQPPTSVGARRASFSEPYEGWPPAYREEPPEGHVILPPFRESITRDNPQFSSAQRDSGLERTVSSLVELLHRDREDRLQREREDRLQREREDRFQRERVESFQRGRDERFQRAASVPRNFAHAGPSGFQPPMNASSVERPPPFRVPQTPERSLYSANRSARTPRPSERPRSFRTSQASERHQSRSARASYDFLPSPHTPMNSPLGTPTSAQRSPAIRSAPISESPSSRGSGRNLARSPIRNQRSSSHRTPQASDRHHSSSQVGESIHSRSPVSERLHSRSPLRTPLQSPSHPERTPVRNSQASRRHPSYTTPRGVVRPFPNLPQEEHRPEVQPEIHGVGLRDDSQVQEVVRRMVREEVARARGEDPPVEEAYGDAIAKESMAYQAILEQLKPFYPQIRRVRSSDSLKTSLEYVFPWADPEGFWSVPKPTYILPHNNQPDRYGYFGVLNSPNITRYWTFTTQNVVTDVDSEAEQSQGEKTRFKSIDSLYKPAVPGRCSEESIEAFLSSKPLADWRNDIQGRPAARYLSLDGEVFRNTRYVKWESHTILPSVEFKARLAARDNYSAVDMLRVQNDKTKSLLVNWNKPYVWDRKTGLARDEAGELLQSLEGLTLEESVSKEDLIEELHMRSRLTELAIAQLVHQGKILVALQSEVKINLRDSFLNKLLKQNPSLVEALQKSRISDPGLFGPVPDFYKYKIYNHNEFYGLTAPYIFSASNPLFRKKNFPSGPSGSRGTRQRSKSSPRQHVNRQARRARGASSKNARQGGQGKTTRVSHPATRGGAASRSKSRPRGGKTKRGRGRGRGN